MKKHMLDVFEWQNENNAKWLEVSMELVACLRCSLPSHHQERTSVDPMIACKVFVGKSLEHYLRIQLLRLKAVYMIKIEPKFLKQFEKLDYWLDAFFFRVKLHRSSHVDEYPL